VERRFQSETEEEVVRKSGTCAFKSSVDGTRREKPSVGTGSNEKRDLNSFFQMDFMRAAPGARIHRRSNLFLRVVQRRTGENEEDTGGRMGSPTQSSRSKSPDHGWGSGFWTVESKLPRERGPVRG